VTNARFASLHGLPVAPSPSRRRPFRFSNRALVTSGIISTPQDRRAPVGSLASSLRLRGFTHFVPPAPPSPSRRQTSDRSFFGQIWSSHPSAAAIFGVGLVLSRHRQAYLHHPPYGGFTP